MKSLTAGQNPTLKKGIFCPNIGEGLNPDIAQAPKFTWDESKSFLGNTAYIIPTDKLWLVGLLNSKPIWWYYQNISSTIRGGFVRFIAQYMKTIPIPPANESLKAPIIKIVDKILAITKNDDYLQNPQKQEKVKALEREIDQMVYKLYGLTDEEIKIVEGETE